MLRTKDELLAQIAVSMGGRAAEVLVLNVQSNGAGQDIQQATSIAQSMVAMYGMSDQFGMMALASRRNQYLDGGYGLTCAQETAAAMDRAVQELLQRCYEKALSILEESREDMDKVVAYLLKKETITGAEMVAILEGRDPETANAAAVEKAGRQLERAAEGDKVIPLPERTDEADGGAPSAPETPDAPEDPERPEEPGRED